MLNILLIVFTLFIPLPSKTTTWFNLGGGINWTTIFIILLAIGALFVRLSEKGSTTVKSPLNLPVFIFILLSFISLWSGVFNFGYSPFGEELHAYKRFVTIFILYFLVLNITRDRKIIAVLLGVIILMLIFEAYVVLKEHYTTAFWHYSDKMRVTGTFSATRGGGANELGAFFAQYLPILIAFFLVMRKRSMKLIFIGLSVFVFLALIYTYSRGSYLSIAAALFVIGIVKSKKFLLAIGVIFIILFSMRILPVSVVERVNSIYAKNPDKSIAGREMVWRDAGRYIKEYPVLGYGYDASNYLLPYDTHNMYLDIALEIGIPAVLVLFWIYIIGFKVAYKLLKTTQDPLYQIISLSFIGSLVALAVGNMFGTRLNFFPINGYFAILMGMMARVSIDVNEDGKLSKTYREVVNNVK